jgi:hypothetical protein
MRRILAADLTRERPYRQWLSTGGFGNYVHIADVWADHELRQQILSRLQRGPISWKKLALYLKLDLEYLDLFAQLGDAAVSDRLYWEAKQENWKRARTIPATLRALP